MSEEALKAVARDMDALKAVAADMDAFAAAVGLSGARYAAASQCAIALIGRAMSFDSKLDKVAWDREMAVSALALALKTIQTMNETGFF